MGVRGYVAAVTVLITSFAVLFAAEPSWANSDSSSSEVRMLKEEIQRLKAETERSQKRIEELEHKVEAVQQKGEEQEKQIESAVARAPSAGVVRDTIDRYWGENRFMISGYGFLKHEWNQNENSNSFEAGFNPIMLFRLNDWILFQSELEVELPDDAETEVNLEFAEADFFLNRYLTVAAGKYLVPFGDFIERLHPPWINKLVSHPLPFRSGHDGGLLPFADVGVQARGGVALETLGEGARFEYTIYGGNGAQFQSDEVGANYGDPNVDNNRGKSVGARVALFPLPLDANAGQLEIGGSTYNAQWNSNGNWLTAAGVHGAYQFGDAELRGEYLQVQRNMPDDAGMPADEADAAPDGVALPHDNRSGWYIQGAYSLAKLAVPYLDRTELVTRYSRQDQRATEEGSPHPRQIAIGVDYWLTHSVVFKLEYDHDMPRDGGDNNVLRSQIALGF
jgi:hypothetical protein